MTTEHLVDPELRFLIGNGPPRLLNADTVPESRAAMQALALRPIGNVRSSSQEIWIPRDDGTTLRALLIKPAAGEEQGCGYLHIHGGGWIAGSPEMNLAELMQLADEVGCIILSVDYRLAPEIKHPGQLEDCYLALRWLHDNAVGLGIAPSNRIGVGGESAGGALAAGLTLFARDQGGSAPPIAFLCLRVPALDDRIGVAKDHPYAGQYVLSRESAHSAWNCFLDKPAGDPDTSPYAAPARAHDLMGFPPTFISAGALDVLAEEAIEFARRLMRAGVPTELHLYPGAHHGFMMAPEAHITRAERRAVNDAIRRALA